VRQQQIIQPVNTCIAVGRTEAARLKQLLQYAEVFERDMTDGERAVHGFASTAGLAVRSTRNRVPMATVTTMAAPNASMRGSTRSPRSHADAARVMNNCTS